MVPVLRRLAGDFFSTILFMIVWAASGDVRIATGLAILAAAGQVAWSRWKGVALNAMTWASLALVVALGTATFLTDDPRFVMMKPSLAHFAIGAIMLKPGWMSRYMPPRVLETAPDLPVVAGYFWAALMFALGAGVIGTALSGDVKLWAIYVSVVAVGAKIVAFLIQYALFRLVIGRRLRAGASFDQTKSV